MEEETWKRYDNSIYEFSNMGRTRNYKSKNIIKGSNNKGYVVVDVNNKRMRVHRIIGELFIKNNDKLPEINHKNGKKDDNRVENLEWIGREGNFRHAQTVLKNVEDSKKVKIYKNGIELHFDSIWQCLKYIKSKENIKADMNMLYFTLGRVLKNKGYTFYGYYCAYEENEYVTDKRLTFEQIKIIEKNKLNKNRIKHLIKKGWSFEKAIVNKKYDKLNPIEKKKCTLCGYPVVANNYCNMHYIRYKKYGDANFVKQKQKRPLCRNRKPI